MKQIISTNGVNFGGDGTDRRGHVACHVAEIPRAAYESYEKSYCTRDDVVYDQNNLYLLPERSLAEELEPPPPATPVAPPPPVKT